MFTSKTYKICRYKNHTKARKISNKYKKKYGVGAQVFKVKNSAGHIVYALMKPIGR